MADKSKFGEIGTTGLVGANPQSGIVTDEFIAKLNGLNGLRAYREMSLNDPVCGAILFAISMLVRGVKWTVEPVDESDEAKANADFVEGVLLEDMGQPFNDVVADAMSMLTYGFAVQEIVFKTRRGPSSSGNPGSKYDDGKIGIHRLAPRGQETIYKWEFNDVGDVVAVKQQTEYKGMVSIPANKCLLYRTVNDKNNPEGRSIFRNAYIQYKRKQLMEEAEGRLALRSAGIVAFRLPAKIMSDSASPDEKRLYAAYKTAADRVAQDRQGSIIMPSDTGPDGRPLFDLTYIVADGRRPSDHTPTITRLNQMIATSVLADFVLLGQDKVGSFALSSDKTALFAKAVSTYLGVISDNMNRVLLPRLYDLNGMDREMMPKLAHGDLQSPDITALANFVSTLATAGASLFPDDTLQDKLMSLANLPTKATETSS
jgi:hypothetical protein